MLMPQLQFRIRTLLIVMAFVATLGAWWVDRSHLSRELRELKTTVNQHGLLFELEDGYLYAPFAELDDPHN